MVPESARVGLDNGVAPHQRECATSAAIAWVPSLHGQAAVLRYRCLPGKTVIVRVRSVRCGVRRRPIAQRSRWLSRRRADAGRTYRSSPTARVSPTIVSGPWSLPSAAEAPSCDLDGPRSTRRPGGRRLDSEAMTPSHVRPSAGRSTMRAIRRRLGHDLDMLAAMLDRWIPRPVEAARSS